MRRNQSDRILIGVLLLLALASGYYFHFERLFFDKDEGAGKIAGQVVIIDKDARHLVSSSVNWRNARRGQFVRIGDSLFTGKDSRAKVKLSRGGSVSMDGNTMVTFYDVDGDQVPGFNEGKFVLRVQGKMKVNINRRLYVIEGDSEVQLEARKDGETFAKLLGGKAVLVDGAGRRQFLNKEKPLSLKENEPLHVRLPALPPPPAFIPEMPGEKFNFIYRVDEIYRRENGALKAKPSVPSALERAVPVRWPMYPAGMSGDVEGRGGRVRFSVRGPSEGILLSQVFLGENILRFAPEGQPLQERRFQVTAGFLANAPEWTGRSRTEVHDGSPAVDLGVTGTQGYSHAIVEFSRTKRFTSSTVRLHRLSDDNRSVRARFPEPGTYYVRLRGVTPEGALSVLSQTRRLNVLERKVASVRPSDAPSERPPPPPPVEKLSPPPPPRTVSPLTEQRMRRNTGADLTYRNHKYSSDKLELEGAAFVMYSRDYITSTENAPPPMAFTGGVRSHLWWNAHGFQAAVKAKTININPQGSVNSPKQLELRYLHRFPMTFNPFFSYAESMFILIGGYEIYRNTGGGLFSQGYDLLKAGFGLSFPALHNWDTGGEILYGSNFKRDAKYEISGHLHYYFKPQWSFGFGYRMHLIEAGSTQSAPGALPYREGFGEGYSALRYHY